MQPCMNRPSRERAGASFGGFLNDLFEGLAVVPEDFSCGDCRSLLGSSADDCDKSAWRIFCGTDRAADAFVECSLQPCIHAQRWVDLLCEAYCVPRERVKAAHEVAEAHSCTPGVLFGRSSSEECFGDG